MDCFASLAMTTSSLISLRSKDDVLALADMRGNDEAFDPVDDPEQDHAEQRENDERREHRRQVEGADRTLQHIADAGIRADEFADDGADHRERDRDLQPRKDRG